MTWANANNSDPLADIQKFDDFMDGVNKESIARQASKIRERITGGNLHGIPVDQSDVDMLIVASYYVGFSDRGEMIMR